MKKFVLAPALAALAMFFLGFLYWGLPMSPAYKTMSRVADDDAAAVALARLFPETGVYHVPGLHVEATKLTALMKRGPTAEVTFMKEGHDPGSPVMFLKGYVHYFVIALLLMIMLLKAVPSFTGFNSRVKFTAAVGLVAAAFELTDTIWGNHPVGYHVAVGIYIFLECTVAGLVLAKFTLASSEPGPIPA
jgi:hypothetical protein